MKLPQPLSFNLNWKSLIFGSACLFILILIRNETNSADQTSDSKTEIPYGLTERIPWKTSRLKGFPDPLPPYTLEIAFPNLKLDQPVAMIPEPGTNRLVILELKGKLWAFEQNLEAKKEDLIELAHLKPVPKPDPVLDAKTGKKIEYKAGNRNTQGFTFHPDYRNNGYIFVTSEMFDPELPKEKSRRYMRVARYTIPRDTPNRVDPDSEKIIIEWDSNGHTGGDLDFGPDGYLYISCGDGSSDSDDDVTGQKISDLQGSIIRIDVDQESDGKPYRIPPDNPFVKTIGARPEIWSFGHRAPWRMSFDQKTGNLWLGDVGQDLWEMIHLVKKGSNYGWSVREGNHPFRPEREIGPVPISPPIVEHHHSESRSITGGLVYYGDRLKDLQGYYIYCDYATGTVWGFQYENEKVINHKVLARSNWQVPSFGLDHQGEIYSVALTGEILRLVPQKKEDLSASFPRKLSETGIFESVSDLKTKPGVISYSINAPSWNDGCNVDRWFAIPDEGKIQWKENRGWDFSNGSVTVQTLSLRMNQDDPESRKNLETRILLKESGEWYGYSYEWNEEQTDAELVSTQGKSIQFKINQNGIEETRTWNIPSRSECMVCHSRAANFVLGLSTLQMNKEHDFQGVIDNQLRTYEHIGLFEKPLSKPIRELRSLVNPYQGKFTHKELARSYLHANCSHCHVKAGGGNAQIELEFITGDAQTNMIDVTPLQGEFDFTDSKIIAKGDPFRSTLLYRISKLGPGRMPHLGSTRVDHKGMTLLRNWIRSLGEPQRFSPVAVENPSNPYEVQLNRHKKYMYELEMPYEEAVKMLESPQSAMMLLELMEKGKLDSSRDRLIADAMNQSNPLVRDLFEDFIPEEKRTKRLGTTFDRNELLTMKGRTHAGRELFLKMPGVLCRNCHQIEKEGKMLGPDLSLIGKKYNKEQLLENILYPSRKIDREYATYVVETKKGKVYSGLLIKQDDKEIVVKNSQHELISVPADEIEEIQPLQKSLMPDMLIKDLTPQQAADLLEYLASLKENSVSSK